MRLIHECVEIGRVEIMFGKWHWTRSRARSRSSGFKLARQLNMQRSLVYKQNDPHPCVHGHVKVDTDLHDWLVVAKQLAHFSFECAHRCSRTSVITYENCLLPNKVFLATRHMYLVLSQAAQFEQAICDMHSPFRVCYETMQDSAHTLQKICPVLTHVS